MNKYISVSIISILVIVALYNSVYFEDLDTKKEKESTKEFNPKDMAEHFWDNKLDEVLKSAIDIKLFDSQLADNPQALIDKSGKSLGITSTFSFLVKGFAKQVQSESEKIPVDLKDGYVDYNLKIKYIFGNTARDAIGSFNINDFENTMDFNALASELNRIILEKEIAKLDSLSPGEPIKFIGAVEINLENIPKQVDLIPLKLERSNDSK